MVFYRRNGGKIRGAIGRTRRDALCIGKIRISSNRWFVTRNDAYFDGCSTLSEANLSSLDPNRGTIHHARIKNAHSYDIQITVRSITISERTAFLLSTEKKRRKIGEGRNGFCRVESRGIREENPWIFGGRKAKPGLAPALTRC